MTETKSILERINNRLDDREWTREPEDRVMEITQAEQKGEKGILNNEASLRDSSNSILCANVGIQKETREGERGRELLKEIIPENVLNLEKKADFRYRKQRESQTTKPKGVHTNSCHFYSIQY